MAGQAPKGRWSFRCGKKEGESLGRQIQQDLKIALGVDQTTWDQVCLKSLGTHPQTYFQQPLCRAKPSC